MKHDFLLCGSLRGTWSKLQKGRAIAVYVFQPDNIPSPGKSLTVHITAARSVNIILLAASNVSTPSLHNSFSSYISG